MFCGARGRNSGVECQLPKLDVAGSNPVARFAKKPPVRGLLLLLRWLRPTLWDQSATGWTEVAVTPPFAVGCSSAPQLLFCSVWWPIQ